MRYQAKHAHLQKNAVIRKYNGITDGLPKYHFQPLKISPTASSNHVFHFSCPFHSRSGLPPAAAAAGISQPLRKLRSNVVRGLRNVVAPQKYLKHPPVVTDLAGGVSGPFVDNLERRGEESFNPRFLLVCWRERTTHGGTATLTATVRPTTTLSGCIGYECSLCLLFLDMISSLEGRK